MTLYEIKEQYLDLLQLISEGEIPADAIQDTLESVEGDFTEKVDNIASFIKNLTAEAAAIREEEKALAERRQAKETKAANLKEYLADAMRLLEKDKVETARNRVSFRKSTSLGFDPEKADAFEDRFWKVTRELRKKDLTDALKAGEKIDGAWLEEKQNIQIK